MKYRKKKYLYIDRKSELMYLKDSCINKYINTCMYMNI